MNTYSSLNDFKQHILVLPLRDKQELAVFLLRHVMEERMKSMPAERNFKAEMQWISENREKYRGQFVALDGGRLLAHGPDELQVIREANLAGVKTPFTSYIETEAEEFSIGW